MPRRCGRAVFPAPKTSTPCARRNLNDTAYRPQAPRAFALLVPHDYSSSRMDFRGLTTRNSLILSILGSEIGSPAAASRGGRLFRARVGAGAESVTDIFQE